jgi:hypothetical protein
MKRILLGGAFALAALSSASAGPVSDFENAYRQMYGAYRAALFKTNMGDAEASTGAMGKFASQFAALDATYGDAPPPHYADDPLWGETMAEAGRLAGQAKAQIAAGELAEAHETLEGVREVFGDLHIRNGVETYSDRMNAYHAEMEHLLGLDIAALDDAMIGDVRERAAVLAYLAADVLGAPPAEAEGNAEYATLAAAFEASVTALLDAARTGDPEAVRKAVSQVKKPYSMLFVKFG